MMRIVTLSVVAAIGSTLLGCAHKSPVAPDASGIRSTPSTEASERLTIATSDWTPRDSQWEARFAVDDVQLSVDGAGCVVLRTDDGSRFDVVWPAGFTAEQTDQGPLIRDPLGRPVLRSGAALETGGGTARASGQPCLADHEAFYVQDEVAPLGPR